MSSIKLSPIITHIYLMVTEQCNLRCQYCYIKNRDIKNEFPFEWMDKIKKMFTCYNKPRIIFFGGEPLLKLDLIKRIVNEYNDDFQFQVVTNGTVNLHRFLTEIYEPNRTKFDIQLSWDGNNFTRKTVNGEISNNIVYDNLLKELQAGYNFEGRCVLDDISVKSFYNTYLTFKKLHKDYKFSGDFTIAHQLCFSKDYAKNLFNELTLIYQDIKKSLLTKDIFIPRTIFKYISNILENESVVSCDVGNYVVIKPNGDVYPCTILSQIDEIFKLGNINTSIDTELINDLRYKSACQKNCKFKSLCDGGCRYERIKNFKDTWCKDICLHTCDITEAIFNATTTFIQNLTNEENEVLMKKIFDYNMWSINYINRPETIDNQKRLISI